jgi:hypothetical protein
MEVAVYNKKSKEASWQHWLKVVRAHDRSQVKQAEIGGRGDDASFEQAFSNLAHAYLRDSAPKLLEHEIGFQLLDRNRENTKAVGVFAFKVGSNWLYAPVFFLNGDLKGHELLYIKNQDMFVPLKENWVNYIINRKPNILGNSVDKNLAALGQRQPDFTQLSRSPAKFGSAQPTLKEMMAAVIPTLAKTATMNTATAFAELGDALNLREFLKSARLETLNVLVKSCQRAPELAEALNEFHGLDIIKEAIAVAKQPKPAKIASVLTEKQAEAVSKLTVITYDLTVQKGLPPEYTEEDQEQLLRDGVLIKDKRDRDEVSIPYHIQVEKKLFNPTESGLYEILVKPGNIERCYVAVYPQGAVKRSDFVTVVRTEGKPTWINVRADHVFALARIEGDEFDSWFNALPDATSLPTGMTRSMLISKQGDTTVPMRVIREYGTTEYGGTAYEVHLEDYSKFPPKGSISPCCYTDPLNYDKYRDGVRVHLNGKKGSSLRTSMGDIFVPEGYKLLKCAPGEDDEPELHGQSTCGCGESEDPPLMPGNLSDAQLALMQKTAALTVYHKGATVELLSRPFGQVGETETGLSEKQALVALVQKHGLREAAARELIKQAAANRKYECRVKYANPYGAPMLINSAPTAPSDPGPVMGGESIMGTSVPTQLGIDVGVPVAGMAASQTDRSVYRPSTELDDKTLQAVMQAAQSGQREVFDTSMVGAMLRTVRDDGLVDRYMGELTKGLDKLGRILFMFYWHGDRFADRYGKADMPELEDSLRNAFEMLGDVILFLKQKTIEPYPEESMSDVDLTPSANI